MTNQRRSRHTGSTRVDASPTKDFIGKCPVCKIPTRVEIVDETRDHCVITCLHCGDDAPRIDAERIYGTTSHDTCDGSCMMATGRLCVCACGGRNHGKVWGKTRESEATASAIEKFFAREKRNIERRERVARQKREKIERTFLDWYNSLSDEERRVVDFISRYENIIQYGLDSMFVLDMRLTVVKNHPYIDEDVVRDSKPLTENQLSALMRTVNGKWNYLVSAYEREIEDAKNAKPVVEGRYTVRGQVISGRYEPEWNNYKILVKCDGYKIWGNCPKEIINDVFSFIQQESRAYTERYDIVEVNKGVTVEFTASIKRSDRDQYFGSFKIAKNARMIAGDELVSAPEIAAEKIVDEPKTVVETATVNAPAKRSGSHSECSHENSKSARAKCRRERGK